MSYVCAIVLALVSLLSPVPLSPTIGGDHEEAPARLSGMGGRGGGTLDATLRDLRSEGPALVGARGLGAPAHPTRRGEADPPADAVAAAKASYLLAGKATHYAACHGCAAAGPDLRAAIGPHYIGKRVTVTSGGISRVVTLVTSCWCKDRAGVPTLIDLADTTFDDFAPLGAGVISVEVTPSESIPLRLPQTDTAPEGGK